MKAIIFISSMVITLVFTAFTVYSQSITISDDNTYTADPSAMLDVKSTNKGMLIPRIDFDDKPASPATGLLIYVSANGPSGNNAFYYYSGTAWLKLIVADSETDPEFTAWDKTTGITISESQITDLQTYLTAEVDASITNEIQNLTEVLAESNDGGAAQVKNISDPTDAQDMATKAYVDLLEAQIEEIQVVAGLKLRDIDSNLYSAVEIGTQTWMAENLKVTHYPNGDAIPLEIDNTAWTNFGENNTDDAYCFYENNSAHGDTYGALYTYAAAIGDDWARDNTANQGICPDGWHLPTDAEWTVLADYLGGASVAGGKMKETGTSHWVTPNTGATNESGFTGLGGGYRYFGNGVFGSSGAYGIFWTATENSSSNAWYRGLYYNDANFSLNNYPKSYGFSVRCMKN